VVHVGSIQPANVANKDPSPAREQGKLVVIEVHGKQNTPNSVDDSDLQNDPVGSVSLVHASDTWLNGRLYEANPKTYLGAAYFKPVKHGDKIYTLPPTAEQIANETAEAIAKMLELGPVYPEDIRNGAWKEFKKS
jgi:hypothetical protein